MKAIREIWAKAVREITWATYEYSDAWPTSTFQTTSDESWTRKRRRCALLAIAWREKDTVCLMRRSGRFLYGKMSNLTRRLWSQGNHDNDRPSTRTKARSRRRCRRRNRRSKSRTIPTRALAVWKMNMQTRPLTSSSLVFCLPAGSKHLSPPIFPVTCSFFHLGIKLFPFFHVI